MEINLTGKPAVVTGQDIGISRAKENKWLLRFPQKW